MPGNTSGTPCNAVLVLEKPMAPPQFFPLEDQAFRKRISGTDKLRYSRVSGSSDVEITDQNGRAKHIKPGGSTTFRKARISLHTDQSLSEEIPENSSGHTESLSLILGVNTVNAMSLARLAHTGNDKLRLAWYCACAVNRQNTTLSPSDFLFLLARTRDGSLPLAFGETLLQKAFHSWPEDPALTQFKKHVHHLDTDLKHLSSLQRVTHLTALQEDQLSCLRTEPFSIFFPSSLNLGLVEINQETLFRARKQLIDYLPSPDNMDVILYTFPEKQAHIYGMVIDGAICLNLSCATDITRFRNTVKHEYIHILHHYYSQNPIARHVPHWLDEGLAHFLAGNTLGDGHSSAGMEMEEAERVLGTTLEFQNKGQRKSALHTACRQVQRLIEKTGISNLIEAALQVLKDETKL